MRWLEGLPVAAWGALAVAAWRDPTHDPWAHYVSWLVDGAWAPLAAVGVAALAASVLAAAWHLQRVMPPGGRRQAAVAALCCGALAGASTLAFPSRGLGEPVWHTARHVGLAVGAYTGVAIAAALVAWGSWQRRAAFHMIGWFAALAVAMTFLLAVSAISRLTALDVQLRGLAQLVLAATAAGWLTGVLALPGPRPSSSQATKNEAWD